jgi:hypothetical protein
MPKSRELVPFANSKPMVPGAPRGRPAYWKQERKIQALESDLKELAKVLARLSGELIEEIIFLQDHPRHTSPEAIRRRISQMAGALKREKSLLGGLLGAGFDLHPLINELFIRKAQEHLERKEEQSDEGDHQSVCGLLDSE